MAAAQTWEYNTLKMPGPPTADDVLLNARGASGWEVVSVFVWSNDRFVLMRRDAFAWKK